MPFADDAIRVHDLRGFARELRAASRAAPKVVQRENKRFAERVATTTRAEYSRQHPSMSGRGAGSIRPLATATRAQVAIGSGRAPYVLGQEFGSIRYRQFPAWRGSGPGAGYFLYPTVREELPELREDYLDAVGDALERAFPS